MAREPRLVFEQGESEGDLFQCLWACSILSGSKKAMSLMEFGFLGESFFFLCTDRDSATNAGRDTQRPEPQICTNSATKISFFLVVLRMCDLSREEQHEVRAAAFARFHLLIKFVKR